MAAIIDRVNLPRIALVRQKFPDRRIPHLKDVVHAQMRASGLGSRVKPDAKIAIGVGSRGITALDEIVRAVVDFWKQQGARPFIFPAMGTHGGATPEGQAQVLAHYGVTEQAMGCPIVSSLDVVPTGKTPEGVETFVDRHAWESDGIFLVNRVKWHTDFTGSIESGLCKMATIGLGKFAGAQQYHAFGHRIGLERVIVSAFRQVLRTGKLLGGLAIVEDALHQPALIAALPAEVWEEKEPELLETAKSWMARLPGERIDLLIVDEMGKNISGTGMDTKVINRSMHGAANCYDTAPAIDRVFVRSLHPLSYGNGIGIGLADVVPDRLLEQIDWEVTYINCLTACTPRGIKTPVHFPTDQECIRRIGPTTGRLDLSELTIAWISNTNELGLLALSETLLAQLGDDPLLEVLGPPLEFPFDPKGNLPPLKELAVSLLGASRGT